MSTKLEQIEALSEQNSLESIQTLIELSKDETLTAEEVSAAEEAFETVSFLYALPQNEEEERDVKLCSLIAKRLDYLEDLAFDFYEEEQLLEEAKLELEVALRLVELAPEDQKEDRTTDLDACQMVIEHSVDECAQIEQDIQETSAWIDCAHELLTTEKYQNLPEECFAVLFPADDAEENDEEEYNCCGSDDCGEEDCEGCEDCEGGCEEGGCGGCEEGGCKEETKEEEEMEGCCGNGGCCK
jgi:hypothetical protein